MLLEQEQVLLEHCATVGRDPSTIERTTGVGTVFIRDDRAEAERLLKVPAVKFRFQDCGVPGCRCESVAP